MSSFSIATTAQLDAAVSGLQIVRTAAPKRCWVRGRLFFESFRVDQEWQNR